MATTDDDDPARARLRLTASQRPGQVDDSDGDFAGRIARDLGAMKKAIRARAEQGGCKGVMWVMLSLQLASLEHLADMLVDL